MRLATTRVGDGPRAVVLLHGFLGSGRNLATLARTWVIADPTRSMVAVDLTGHGKSPPLPPDATMETLAADVLDTAQGEGLPAPYTLVGHSLGGRVALQATLLDRSLIRHVGLLDISPSPIREAGDELSDLIATYAAVPAVFPDRESARQALLGSGVSRQLAEWLLTNLVAVDGEYRWRVDRAAMLALRPSVNRTDLWPALEHLGSQARCIRGGRSAYVSDEDAARMERLGCHVDTIAESGHFLHVDRLQELVGLLVGGTP